MIGFSVVVEAQTLEDAVKGLRKAISIISQGYEGGFEEGQAYTVSWSIDTGEDEPEDVKE